MNFLNKAWRATNAEIKALPEDIVLPHRSSLSSFYTLHARGLISAIEQKLPEAHVTGFLNDVIETINEGLIRTSLQFLAHDIYERLPNHEDEFFDEKLIGIGIISDRSKLKSLQDAREAHIGIIPATRKIISPAKSNVNIVALHKRMFPTLPIVLPP